MRNDSVKEQVARGSLQRQHREVWACDCCGGGGLAAALGSSHQTPATLPPVMKVKDVSREGQTSLGTALTLVQVASIL